jgi:hypothetical protein
MPTVGGLDIHRKQITFDYLDTGTGQVEDRYNQPPPGTRPQVPAAPRRMHLCADERAPSRSSSEPGSALRSPVTTG